MPKTLWLHDRIIFPSRQRQMELIDCDKCLLFWASCTTICMPLSQKMDSGVQWGMRMCNVCNVLVKSPSLFGNYASLTFCPLLDNIRILIPSVPDKIRLMIGCHKVLQFSALRKHKTGFRMSPPSERKFFRPADTLLESQAPPFVIFPMTTERSKSAGTQKHSDN